MQKTLHKTDSFSRDEGQCNDQATVCSAQVKNWGSGEPADLGELQVESFSQDLFSDHSKPFYEQLARRLEELQVNNFLLVLELFALQLHDAWYVSSMVSVKMLVH